jgi:23S rRNA (pseudouridine1915-N3)-methyltransferase
LLHINIICVGKIKESFFRDAISEYSKRLSRFCLLNIIEVPDEKIPDKINSSIEISIKEKEGLQILSHLKNDSYNIALDLKGKHLDSVEFSKKISDLSLYNSTINFIIGGSLGISNSVLEKCNESVCFSKMTFPHQLIRIFLLEQLYRAFKIANNESYHK